MTASGSLAGPELPEPFGIEDLGSSSFNDARVLFAIKISDRTGVLPALAKWRDEERARLGRHAGGAPSRFPPDALWVVMILAALDHQPMNATTFAEIMFTKISPAMRARLGIPDPPERGDLLAWLALYRCVRTRFHSLLETIDPSLLPKNRRLGPADFDAAVSQYRRDNQLTDEMIARRSERLVWGVNAIIEASWTLVPRRVRRQWKGSIGLDATPIPAFARLEQRARGKGPRAKRPLVTHSADPDAGLYVRTEYSDETTFGARAGKRLREAVPAYEATLVVAGNDDPSTAQPFPSLVVGMTLHRPGTAISRNGIDALTSVVQRGHPTGSLAADRAYSNAIAEDFQLPARALGYRLVFDYRVDQLGIQDTYEGALLVDGWWYSPGIPTPLITATRDYRKGHIDEGTWRSRIEARRSYRLRLKERPDPNGNMRLSCPAAGHAPLVGCELKPRSIERTTSARPRIQITDELRDSPPKICEQEVITVPPDAGAKFLQDLQYGSPEWEALYSTLRNTIEGMNGVAKDGAYAALGDPSRRRIRGIAAQSIFVALLLMATNIRKLDSFLRTAVADKSGVLRKPRRRRRATRRLAEWKPDVVARAGAPPP